MILSWSNSVCLSLPVMFFIRFLAEPGDLVLDIFDGSNTTGHVAEARRGRSRRHHPPPEPLNLKLAEDVEWLLAE